MKGNHSLKKSGSQFEFWVEVLGLYEPISLEQGQYGGYFSLFQDFVYNKYSS